MLHPWQRGCSGFVLVVPCGGCNGDYICTLQCTGSPQSVPLRVTTEPQCIHTPDTHQTHTHVTCTCILCESITHACSVIFVYLELQSSLLFLSLPSLELSLLGSLSFHLSPPLFRPGHPLQHCTILTLLPITNGRC